MNMHFLIRQIHSPELEFQEPPDCFGLSRTSMRRAFSTELPAELRVEESHLQHWVVPLT